MKGQGSEGRGWRTVAPWGLAVMLGLGCASSSQDSSPEPPSSSSASADAKTQSSSPDPTADEAGPFVNTIRWATASEQDNFGYDVYRSESAEGPFERLNEEVIEGGGTVDETRRYEFADDTIDPYRTYYYYVESISFSGEREAFTPIGKAKPKLPADDE